MPLALGALCLAVWGMVAGGTFQDDDLVGPLGLEGGWRIRPFLRLTFSIQEALHGHRADLLLAGNLALLALTALGVWAVAVRRLGPTAAFLAGAVFLLQPAHAEAVAYVSGRSTGLMAALAVWCVRAHLGAVHAGEPVARRRWTALSMVLLVLAALSKEVALVVPLLAWLASRWDAPERPSRVGPLLATAVGTGLLLGLVLPRYRTLAGWSLERHGPLSALAEHLSALPAQLSLWVRPAALSIVHAPGDGWVSPAPGAALLLAVAGAAVGAPPPDPHGLVRGGLGAGRAGPDPHPPRPGGRGDGLLAPPRLGRPGHRPRAALGWLSGWGGRRRARVLLASAALVVSAVLVTRAVHRAGRGLVRPARSLDRGGHPAVARLGPRLEQPRARPPRMGSAG